MSTLRLANHIEAIHFRGQDPSKQLHRPFNNGRTKAPPTLHRRGVNRILVFPGSFNPLHQGHVDFLRHAFENAGDDLYIIGAIVIMTDDERLRIKMSEKEGSLVLSREQRVNLWRGVDSILDWTWVYDRSEADWTIFRTELTSRLRRNGLELKFSLLGGPDHISTQGLPDLQLWGCADAVTSDVSRPVNFRYPNSLRQLSGCTMWERPNIDQGKLEQEIRAKLQGKPEQVVKQQVSAAFEKLNAIWVCHRVRKPKGAFRYIQCDRNPSTSQPPSSTQIRELLLKEPKSDQLKLLTPSADLLITYVPEYGVEGKIDVGHNEPVLANDKVSQKVPDDIIW